MDLFVSHVTAKLDAKGRVSIPAAFRAVLARDGFEGLYLHPSLDAPALDCGGHGLLRQIDALMAALPLYSEERDSFSTALFGASEILKLDGEGRIVLTARLKEATGIASEVAFVGQGQKFQIWEPGRFLAHLGEAREKVRGFRVQLGARAAAAPPAGVRG